MGEETLEALRGSIAKWEGIVAGTGLDDGRNNCPLCQLFPVCRGCPVNNATSLSSCKGTPYEKWLEITFPTAAGREAKYKEQLAVAQEEVDFLKSLLPRET